MWMKVMLLGESRYKFSAAVPFIPEIWIADTVKWHYDVFNTYRKLFYYNQNT